MSVQSLLQLAALATRSRVMASGKPLTVRDAWRISRWRSMRALKL
jgi:hypothetical protein